jgi:hypothetical protein
MWGRRPTRVVDRPTLGAPRVPSSGGAMRRCWRGRGYIEDLFLKGLREVLLHRTERIILAGFWRNEWDYLLVGHGRWFLGCWW